MPRKKRQLTCKWPSKQKTMNIICATIPEASSCDIASNLQSPVTGIWLCLATFCRACSQPAGVSLGCSSPAFFLSFPYRPPDCAGMFCVLPFFSSLLPSRLFRSRLCRKGGEKKEEGRKGIKKGDRKKDHTGRTEENDKKIKKNNAEIGMA